MAFGAKKDYPFQGRASPEIGLCVVYRPGECRLARAQRVSWLFPRTHTHRPDCNVMNVPQLSPVVTGHHARRTERKPTTTSYAIPVHIGPGPGRPGSLADPSAEEGHSMLQVSKPEDSLRRPTTVFQLQQDRSELHQAPCPRRREVGRVIYPRRSLPTPPDSDPYSAEAFRVPS